MALQLRQVLGSHYTTVVYSQLKATDITKQSVFQYYL